jgi:hypothetical protein
LPHALTDCCGVPPHHLSAARLHGRETSFRCTPKKQTK